MSNNHKDDELVPTTIRIKKSQKDLLDEKAINLSKWVRHQIDQEFNID